eukprot:1158363-Pelagomonas_calceolata.AAC.5
MHAYKHKHSKNKGETASPGVILKQHGLTQGHTFQLSIHTRNRASPGVILKQHSLTRGRSFQPSIHTANTVSPGACEAAGQLKTPTATPQRVAPRVAGQGAQRSEPSSVGGSAAAHHWGSLCWLCLWRGHSCFAGRSCW